MRRFQTGSIRSRLVALILCLAITPLAAQIPPPLSDAEARAMGFRVAETPSRELPGYRPIKRMLVHAMSGERLAMLQAIAPDVEFVAQPGMTLDDSVSGEFDAIALACPFNTAMKFAPGAAWVQSYSAGVENCLAHPAASKSEFVMTNTSGAASEEIAEHAIAMMMSFSRSLHVYRDAQKQSKWPGGLFGRIGSIRTVAGKTMLVLGLGSIGKEVAKRAKALGMNVLATRNSSREGPEYVDYVGLSDETLGLAARADVIVNALPMTPKTKGLVDAEFFVAMKNDALIISIGRGGTMVTDDLVAALNDGELAGAALDVTEPEPLPAGHPLWTMGNVILTPHIAGWGSNGQQRAAMLFFENLRRYQAGEPLLNQVTVTAGY